MLVTVTGGACNKSCHWHLNFTFQKLGPGPWPGVTVPVPVPVPESESESDWKQHEAHRGWRILWPAGVLKLSFVSLSLLVLADSEATGSENAWVVQIQVAVAGRPPVGRR
jgi:hypothetical protein